MIGEHKAVVFSTCIPYTYDDAGKLLTATETQAGCGTTSWRYAYDLMGNRILEEKKNPGGKVMENNRYAYNDSNQLAPSATAGPPERSATPTMRTETS